MMFASDLEGQLQGVREHSMQKPPSARSAFSQMREARRNC